MQIYRYFPLYILAALLLISCGKQGLPSVNDSDPASAEAGEYITRERAIQADDEAGNWLLHGRTYSEQRFSPLDEINDKNVSNLGLAWYVDTDVDRGLEASPIVIDGVMFTTGSWSVAYALDAATGNLLWKYDPEVPPEWAVNLCCDVVNRGVAVWGDRVYWGTLDGRLIAVDAKSGALAWEVQTTDKSKPYSITGAPRIVNGKVIIGNGGAELGVRGYVSAYDATDGSLLWRFYTVPGNPAAGYETETVAMAAETWKGGQWWKYGGGGTVWDSMAYDPELNLLYFGVGNGSPWNQYIRSPGGGDNLFLSSIVAVNPDDGSYVWHYQTTPGERWDYTATQHLILAELEIEGRQRKVIMQAPKNGFFYVLDRETGEFISANNYVPVNWASHIDPENGRPVLNPDVVDYEHEPKFMYPSPIGGHNWHPMSYSPLTGLVYIPAQDIPYVFEQDEKIDQQNSRWHTGLNHPGITEESIAALKPMLKGRLLAWDPVQQRLAWSVEHANPWNAGVLSTAGNLVFQGTPDGRFEAYSADSGSKLWEMQTQTGVLAPPVTYTVDGEQYITLMAGWGGGYSLQVGAIAELTGARSKSRILTFKLGGEKQLPPLEDVDETSNFTGVSLDPEKVALGNEVYHAQCQWCHGNGGKSGGTVPDLRFMSEQTHENYLAIVLGGLLYEKGMIGFGDRISLEDAEAIRSYIASVANAKGN